ncbi:MAG: glycosyltransferase [Candidatus Brockarchaeota archaeon]|nr:glycosyltransferase [Candidatus Brockarchaeota archaeon]
MSEAISEPAVKVSIIIPVKNNVDLLEKCLASIRSLDFPTNILDVVVVDGGSNDGSVEVAEKFGCRVIIEDKSIISYARDLGVKHASGEFIAFTDSDCIVDKGWLKELLKCFEGDGIAAVGGPNLTPENESDFGKSVGDVFAFLSKAGPRYGLEAGEAMEIHHNPTCNVMYRRGVLEEVGGFNHKLVTVDDEELDYRIRRRGYRILYTPKAIVYHYRRRGWRSFARMAYNYGLGRTQAIKLHRDMGRWFHYAPPAIILLIFLLLALSLVNSIFLISAFLTLFLGGVGIAFMSLYLSGKTGRSPLRYFGLIAVWFWGYGLGMLRGLEK